VACLVVQPPDIKPLRGTVRALAHSNLKHCRFMEAVLQQQKVKIGGCLLLLTTRNCPLFLPSVLLALRASFCSLSVDYTNTSQPTFECSFLSSRSLCDSSFQITIPFIILGQAHRGVGASIKARRRRRTERRSTTRSATREKGGEKRKQQKQGQRGW